MPNPIISQQDHDALSLMAGGRVMVGTLGEIPLRPNRRMFRMDDGTEIHEYCARLLLKRAYIRVINVDGARNYMVITSLGRDALEHATIRKEKKRTPAPARAQGR